MARIASISIPSDKRIVIALTYISGVGLTTSKKVLKEANVSESTKTKDLLEEEVNRIRTIIEKNYTVEGELRREVLGNVKRLKEIGSYRGTRHANHLPARGQRTKTNSRTVRGNKRNTAGSGRRIVSKT